MFKIFRRSEFQNTTLSGISTTPTPDVCYLPCLTTHASPNA